MVCALISFKSVVYAFRYALAAWVAASVLNVSPLFAAPLLDGVGAVSDVRADSEADVSEVPEVFDPGTIASGEGEAVEDSELIRAGSFPHPAKNSETLADKAIRRFFIKTLLVGATTSPTWGDRQEGFSGHPHFYNPVTEYAYLLPAPSLVPPVNGLSFG